MELFLAAYLSKDVAMLDAIRRGLDLHSYSAVLIFDKEWLNAGESDAPKVKPKSVEGKIMRNKVKGLGFSLLYGTGVQAFSENANIPVSEGKVLMAKYFATFPELAKFFQDSGKFALRDLYVREPYFNRVRFFNRPKNGAEASHVKNAAMNYKPQAANGSIAKYAMCLMKRYIEDNAIDHKVKMHLQVYDQLTTSAREDYAEEWAEIQTKLMEKAALHAIPEGTIKAETAVLNHWTK